MTYLHFASLIAGFILILGVRSVILTSKSIIWKEAQGKITSHEIQQSYSTTSSYYPLLEYEFDVDGKKVVGSTIWQLGKPVYADENEAKTFLLENYPLNKEFTIYYNELKPKQSHIVPGKSKAPVIFLIVGIILSMGVGYFWLKKYNIV